VDAQSVELPHHLATLPLFSAMSATELQRLAAGCQLRHLQAEEMVFHVGQRCQEFHVNLSGQIKLFALSPAGQEKVIELLGPGHSFAEALMFTDRPYIISAQALTDTLLLTVPKAIVLAEIAHDAQFALRMLAGVSRRLHGLLQDVEAYSLHSGLERIIGYLLRDQDLAQGGRSEAVTVPLPVSKATIASRLSLTPEYFSRVLHELATAGLIDVGRREIVIRDARRLAAYRPAD